MKLDNISRKNQKPMKLFEGIVCDFEILEKALGEPERGIRQEKNDVGKYDTATYFSWRTLHSNGKTSYVTPLVQNFDLDHDYRDQVHWEIFLEQGDELETSRLLQKTVNTIMVKVARDRLKVIAQEAKNIDSHFKRIVPEEQSIDGVWWATIDGVKDLHNAHNVVKCVINQRIYHNFEGE